ncbi:MAG TPA: hypothetical protein VGQ19_09850, partial [Burkholderiales bacterium]|nr:hypothetical protein [Burkholderiales bacterium]
NTYGYAGHAPLRYSDPRGESVALEVLAVGGIVVVLAVIANQSSKPKDGSGGPTGSDKSGGSPDPCRIFPGLCPSTEGSQTQSQNRCPGSDKQFGKKFGEHMDPQRPGYGTHQQYRELADRIYNDPKAQRTQFPQDGGRFAGETHLQVGDDLLRLDPNGQFRSLYPISPLK